VTLFQLPDSAPLFILMSSSRSRYAIMPSPDNFTISPGTRSGPAEFVYPDRSISPPHDFYIISEWFACVFSLY